MAVTTLQMALTFLETTDIQKEFYFTHDSGRVKNAEWGAASNLKRDTTDNTQASDVIHLISDL
jgi:hypothetical protein